LAEGSKRYRISFIVGSLVQGGAEKQFLYILRTLKLLDIEYQALLLTRSEYYERIFAEYSIPTISIGEGSFLKRIFRISKEIKNFKPDFIQATHFFASFYAGAVGRILHIPSIGAIRGDFFHDLSGVGRIGKFLLFLPTIYVANSNNARENAVGYGLDPQRIFVLRNVIDVDEFDQHQSTQPIEHPLPQGFIYVCVVARLIKIKRLERFVLALAKARTKVPNLIGLVIGGGPEMNNLISLASSLELLHSKSEDGIKFYGNQTEIPQFLSQSDIFLLTSDREGFPNVFLEAMAASLPIITTPAGEAPYLIQNGENGYLVPYDDLDALKDKLIELSVNPSLRIRLGANGRRMVQQAYDLPQLHQNLEELYLKINDYLQTQQTKQKRQTRGMSKQV
jgi:glycosyltransferase involved in cell wall biosynthesis